MHASRFNSVSFEGINETHEHIAAKSISVKSIATKIDPLKNKIPKPQKTLPDLDLLLKSITLTKFPLI